jgi:SNF2 family DNA or RNA helicase
MGLGKTFQIIALLVGLMRTDEVKRVLIISPVSVITNWHREILEHLAPHVKVFKE